MRGVIAAVAIAGCSAAPTRSVTVSSVAGSASTGGVALGGVTIDGHAFAVDYTFDRNALVAIAGTPRGPVAVTASGNLLRYDPRALDVAREAIAIPAVRCIAGGATTFVGVDGAIAVLDPDTLAMRRLVAIPGRPLWLGTYAHGSRLAVAVAVSDAEARIDRFDIRDLAAPVPLGSVAAPTHVPDLTMLPTSWLVDRHDRLWYALDGGEFGGDLERIDLASGRVEAITGLVDDRVRGLVERDGVMWAYGGLDHMMFSDGFVARIDGDHATAVWRRNGVFQGNDDGSTTIVDADTTAPIRLDAAAQLADLSIAQLWPIATGWRTILGADVYQASPDLAHWTVVAHDLDRVVGVALAGSDVIAATGRGGVARIRTAGIDHHVVPDQLAAHADRLIASTAGVFLLDDGDSHQPWHEDGGRWSRVDVSAFGTNFGVELRSLPDRAPWLYISGTAETPNVAARWDGTKFRPVWTGNDGPSAGVAAIDDTLWAHDDDRLMRLGPDGWTSVGAFALRHDILEILRLRAIAGTDLVIDDDKHRLFELHDRDTTHASLVAALTSPAQVFDAIVDGARTLVATDAGLRVVPGGAAVPGLAGVTFLARDADGRIWEASHAAVEVGSHELSLPVLDGRPISSVAVSRGEVMLGLGANGVIRIRAQSQSVAR